MRKSREDQSFFTSFILGILTGAAVTFLFTTKEGEKAKKKLLKKGKEILDDLPGLIEEAKKKKPISRSVAPHLKKLQKRGRQAAKKVNRVFHKSGRPLS